MALLMSLYPDRTKDFCNKASFILRVFKSFYRKFSLSAAVQVPVLLLLFMPSAFSQVTRFPARESAGNTPVSQSVAQTINGYSLLQATVGEKYQAMPYSSIKNKTKTLPRKVISNPFKIRRTRGLVSKTTFHVIDGVVSTIRYINNGLRYPDTGNPPWQFYKRPPGTIFKLRI